MQATRTGRWLGGLGANLLGEDALPPGVLAVGIPPCAITTVDDLNPVIIASGPGWPRPRSAAPA